MRDLPPNMTDYLATRTSFRLEVPEVYNYARDVVDARAAAEPGKLALLAVGPDGGDARRFSFTDLAAASDRAARFLAARSEEAARSAKLKRRASPPSGPTPSSASLPGSRTAQASTTSRA